MSKKQKLLNVFLRAGQVDKQKAENIGVENFRQQVYFLRQDGHRIINIDKRTYKLLK